MSAPLRRRIFVHLIYMDDSAEDAGHQVIAAVVIPENDFLTIESYLAEEIISKVVPEDMRPKFEFHASKLFHSRDEFSVFTRDDALRIFNNCMSIVEGAPLSIVYGAVDLRALRRSLFSTAQPTDIAFRLCMEGINEWFVQKASMLDQVGILICDDTEKQHIKKNMQQAYRAYRKKWSGKKNIGRKVSGTQFEDFLHDDMYFGDSAYSVGIQLADICAFIILRHLQGHEDTEYLYQRMKPQIVSERIEPHNEQRIQTVRSNDGGTIESSPRRDQEEARAGESGESKKAEA
jgi:Protein of unknown function (DUF3800)